MFLVLWPFFQNVNEANATCVGGTGEVESTCLSTCAELKAEAQAKCDALEIYGGENWILVQDNPLYPCSGMPCPRMYNGHCELQGSELGPIEIEPEQF